MNDDVERDIMRHVERAVRPVRATETRKLRMREELLAHGVGVFEEELERTGDESAAMQSTLARLGNAETVGRDLQDSVPWHDRLGRIPMDPSPSVGESFGRYLLRLTSVAFGVVAVAEAIAMVLVPLVSGRNVLLGEVAVVMAIGAIFTASMAGLFLGLCASLHGVMGLQASRRLAWAFGVGTGLFVVAFVQGIGALFGPWSPQPVWVWIVFLGGPATLLPILFAIWSRTLGEQLQRLQEWQRLEIAE